MTNSPPPDPRSSQTTALGFDEFIAIFVAFTTIGAMFWSLSQRNQGFQLPSILSASPSPTDLTVVPQATASPSPAPVCRFSSSRPRVTGCVDTGAESHPNSRTGS